jgi:hypothetical protein
MLLTSTTAQMALGFKGANNRRAARQRKSTEFKQGIPPFTVGGIDEKVGDSG